MTSPNQTLRLLASNALPLIQPADRYDIGKNTFHLAGLDKLDAIVMRIKVSRSQLVRQICLPPFIGLEAGSGGQRSDS